MPSEALPDEYWQVVRRFSGTRQFSWLSKEYLARRIGKRIKQGDSEESVIRTCRLTMLPFGFYDAARRVLKGDDGEGAGVRVE